MTEDPKRLFCFGYGYTGAYLADSLRREGGWTFAGTTRGVERKAGLQHKGIDTFIFDSTRPGC